MSKILIFFIISISLTGFDIITLSNAPIINKIIPKSIQWGYANCQIYADKEETTEVLDEKQKNHREKTLCRRRKAMFGLEYSSFIFDLYCGFICSLLSFLHYKNIGKNSNRNIGLAGMIGGGIGFLLTFIYFVYSGYIFINDVYEDDNGIKKDRLFPNGASQKLNEQNPCKYIYYYEGETDYNSQYVKFNQLGRKEYNYNSDYHKFFFNKKYDCTENGVTNIGSSCCNYIFAKEETEIKNRYIFQRWVTTLVFGFLIVLCNIGIIVFGILLFKEENSNL